jgi:Tol biopolymer transport system component
MPSIPMLLIRRALLGAALSALTACGGDTPTGPGDPGPRPVAAVQLSAPRQTLTVGETLQLVATPKSSQGDVLDGRPVTWASSATDVATVSATGLVTALRPGAATLRATSEGVTGSIAVTIDDVPAASITLDIGGFRRGEGETFQLGATLRSASGDVLEGRAITWSSEDATVATVDANGLVTMVHEGRTRIVARYGSLTATANAQVTMFFAANLLFDMYDGMPLRQPRLFGGDARTPTASPYAIFEGIGNWDASAAADGSRIVFTCTSDGPSICSSDRYGDDLRVLTGGDRAYEDQPALSPDGTLIAYRRYPHGGTPGFANPTEIWVMNADGSNPRNLTMDSRSQHHPTWSPSTFAGGMRLAFATETIRNGYLVSYIETMRADGSDRRELTPDATQFDVEPSWSPDGSRLAFTRSTESIGSDLMVVDVATGVVTPLLSTPLSGEQRGAAWSPDGQHVAFVSSHEPSNDGGFRAQIWTVRADGTRLSRRTDAGGDKANPAWLARP